MNVVLINIHGLNAHWLSPFGNEWVSTPACDQLASQATCFDHHYAEEPTPAGHARWVQSLASIHPTLSSHGVWMAFLDDRRIGADDPRSWHAQAKPAYASFESAAEARVAAFEEAISQLPAQQPWLWCIESDRLRPPWDADTETYLDYARNVGGFTEGSESNENPDALPWNDPPFGPLPQPTDAQWHRLRNTFATTLAGWDAELEMLLEILQEQRKDRQTAIILTSSYGLALGEHDWLGDATLAPYEEFAHVPLMIHIPNSDHDRQRIAEFTQHSDLAPTLLDLFGCSASVTGQSLLSLLRGQPSRRSHALSVVATEHGPSYALRVPEWAYIKPARGEPALFQKPDDRWEISDVARPLPGPCEELDALLGSLTKEPTA